MDSDRNFVRLKKTVDLWFCFFCSYLNKIFSLFNTKHDFYADVCLKYICIQLVFKRPNFQIKILEKNPYFFFVPADRGCRCLTLIAE